MKFEHLNVLVKQDVKHNNVPMLVGEPGIGKSSWVEDFAARELGTRCFCLACNQLADKADLTGARLVPVGKNKKGEDDYAQYFYPHKIIRDAIEYAEAHPDETPILFLDEINRSTPDVTSEALSIPTMRSIGDRHIPDNLKVIIAGNDKGNVCALDKASITRFVMYHIEPDATTFINVNKNLNPYIISVLKKNPSFIYQDAVTLSGSDGNGKDDDDDDDVFEVEFDDVLEQMTTPRTITAASRWLNEYSYDELMQMMNTIVGDNSNLLQEALIAHCGNTPFTIAVIEEIINSSVNATGTTGAPLTVTEPAKYKTMCNAQTRDEMRDIVDKLSDDEKSAILLYSVYDGSRDNSEILNVLVPETTKMNPNDTTLLINMNQSHQLDKANLDALMSQNGKLIDMLKMLSM